jgi:hypothetical protein
MKYTEEQKKQLKDKNMNGFTKHDRPIPVITIKDGYYIIQSKMN